MRLLAFADHLSSTSSGGAERVAAEVYERLARDHGIRTTVISVLRPGHTPATIPGVDVVQVPGVDVSRVVGAELLLGRGLARIARALHAQVSPDVIHGNGLHFLGTCAAARLANWTGTPLVTTAHLGDLSALGPFARTAGRTWDATLGRRIVARSAGCVTVSHAVAKHLRSLGARDDSLTVAPNGVDHARFHTDAREPVGSAPSLRAAFVGRLIGNKGPAMAIDALAQARRGGADVTLTLLGEGPQKDALVRQTRALGVADRVTFAGHVADVGGRLREHDVLVRPSLTEGLPLAVLEAMACGLPVICTSVPGNTEIVVDGVTGLHVAPRDAGAAAHALARLAGHRETLTQMSRAAVEVAATHTWEGSALAHAAALRAALGHPGVVAAEHPG